MDAEDDSEEANKQTEKVQEYVRSILNERIALDRKYPIADRLLEQGKPLCHHSSAHTVD